MRAVFLICLLVNTEICISQVVGKFELDEKEREYLYSSTLNNFLLFQSNRTLETNKERISNGEINRIDFGRYFLDTNSFYDLKMDIIDIPESPFKGYVLISISNYNTGYTRLFGKSIENNFGSNVGVIPGDLIANYKRSMDLSLIAYKPGTKAIIYIAGPFFTQNIWNWFLKQDALTADELKEYIMFKYYNFKPSNIIIQSDMEGATFFSEANSLRYFIKVSHISGDKYSDELIEYQK